VRKIVVALVTAALASACGQTSPRGEVAEAAERARREGRKTAGWSSLGEETEFELVGLGTTYTIVVARPDDLAAAQTVTADMIYTWAVFHVDEILSKGKGQTPLFCKLSKPPSLVLRPDEIAISFAGGTTIINGVKVRVTTNSWFPDDINERYVLFLEACSGQVMAVPGLGEGVFALTETNEFVTSPGSFLGRQIADIGTLDKFRQMLQFRERP
jgi:hypothetical protein